MNYKQLVSEIKSRFSTAGMTLHLDGREIANCPPSRTIETPRGMKTTTYSPRDVVYFGGLFADDVAEEVAGAVMDNGKELESHLKFAVREYSKKHTYALFDFTL